MWYVPIVFVIAIVIIIVKFALLFSLLSLYANEHFTSTFWRLVDFLNQIM